MILDNTGHKSYLAELDAYEKKRIRRRERRMPQEHIEELDSLKNLTTKYSISNLYTFLYDYDRNNNGDLTNNQRFTKVVGLIRQIIVEDKCPLEIDLKQFLLNNKPITQ